MKSEKNKNKIRDNMLAKYPLTAYEAVYISWLKELTDQQRLKLEDHRSKWIESDSKEKDKRELCRKFIEINCDGSKSMNDILNASFVPIFFDRSLLNKARFAFIDVAVKLIYSGYKEVSRSKINRKYG